MSDAASPDSWPPRQDQPEVPPDALAFLCDKQSPTATLAERQHSQELVESKRSTALFAGVFLPVICCLLSFPNIFARATPNLLSPGWQSLPELASRLMSHAGMAPLYPFLLHSMVAFWLVTLRAKAHRGRVVVRTGIYAGVILAFEYWVLFVAAVSECRSPAVLVKNAFLFAAGIGVVTSILAGLRWGVSRLGENFLPWIIFIIGAGCMVATVAGAIWPQQTLALVALLIVGPFIGALFCATTWCLMAYSVAAVRLWRWRRESTDGKHFSLAQLLVVVGWFAAHCAAWRLAVQLVLSGSTP